MTQTILISALFGLLIGTTGRADDQAAKPDPKPERVTYKVTGLFDRDRVPVLRDGLQQLKDIRLVAVNFDEAEITVEYVPSKAFPGSNPKDITEQFNQRLRQVTHHTIGVKPRRTVARDKLKPVVIPVYGLDCKACCLACYEIVAQIDGVEQATASFKERRVTALIDPGKTDREKIKELLRKRGVDVGKVEKK